MYGRLVIDPSANDFDVGSMGVMTGQLKPWPHKGRKLYRPNQIGVTDTKGYKYDQMVFNTLRFYCEF